MPFSSLGLHADLLRGLRELGFTRPTPVQEQAIPPALEGHDLLATASTGSGKTAAFLLPILHRLSGRPRGTTRALVLTPTRELAAQIVEHLDALAVHTPLTGAAIFGGVGPGPQEHALRSGVDVVVATPGRLLDHLRRPYARLQGLEVLVLDESDRMLDMGFLPDIRRILKQLPARRQTLLFSATLPPEIETLAHDMLNRPTRISVERRIAPAAGITHAVYPVPAELKSALLVELVKRGDIRSVIAFTRTKHRANRLADYLLRHGVSAGRIHGNRSQSQREQALEGFKAGRFPVLVATDIAARGIDVDALSHVVNFDVPASPDDYVHRAGRTARAGATGDAFLLASPQEAASLKAIERAIGKPLPRVILPGFDYAQKAPEKLEIPLGERLARHRQQQRQGGRRPEQGQREHVQSPGRSRPPRPHQPATGQQDRPAHADSGHQRAHGHASARAAGHAARGAGHVGGHQPGSRARRRRRR